MQPGFELSLPLRIPLCTRSLRPRAIDPSWGEAERVSQSTRGNRWRGHCPRGGPASRYASTPTRQ